MINKRTHGHTECLTTYKRNTEKVTESIQVSVVLNSYG